MARQADDAPVEEPDGARVDARGEEASRGASPLPIGAAPSLNPTLLFRKIAMIIPHPSWLLVLLV